MPAINWTAVTSGLAEVSLLVCITCLFILAMLVITSIPMRTQLAPKLPQKLSYWLRKRWSSLVVDYAIAANVHCFTVVIPSFCLALCMTGIWFPRSGDWQLLLMMSVGFFAGGFLFLRLWHQYEAVLVLLDRTEQEVREYARQSKPEPAPATQPQPSPDVT